LTAVVTLFSGVKSLLGGGVLGFFGEALGVVAGRVGAECDGVALFEFSEPSHAVVFEIGLGAFVAEGGTDLGAGGGGEGRELLLALVVGEGGIPGNVLNGNGGGIAQGEKFLRSVGRECEAAGGGFELLVVLILAAEGLGETVFAKNRTGSGRVWLYFIDPHSLQTASASFIFQRAVLSFLAMWR